MRDRNTEEIMIRGFMEELFKIANGDEEDMSGPAPTEEQVIKFLQKHPSPKDEDFHEWAEENGFNVHKAEAVAYKIISDLVNKGRSKGKAPAGVSKENVKQGVKIEAEHTPNKMIQRKITNDHDAEFGEYYNKKKGLPALEKSLEKKGGFGEALSLLTKRGADSITTDVPLFIRMLEWAKEDAKTDMQLHKATEKLLGMGGKLSMKNYNAAVGGEGMPSVPSESGMAKKGEKMVKCPITGKMVPAEGRGAGRRSLEKRSGVDAMTRTIVKRLLLKKEKK